MFPYPSGTLNLFGTSIGVFTPLVALAIAIGTYVMDREMDRLGFSGRETVKILFVILIAGLYASHFVALFFYNFDRLGEAGWLAFIDPLNGMSSTGGFLGAAAAFFLITRWYKGKTWEVADVVVISLISGWGVARLACTLSFDHPGTLSGFFLAFDHPLGGPRHNLGFYEMLYTFFVLAPAAWFLRKNRSPAGSQLAVACLLYAPARYLMDFLRAADTANPDVRYLGLTFAQYVCIFLLLAGLWLFNSIGGRNILRPPQTAR